MLAGLPDTWRCHTDLRSRSRAFARCAFVTRNGATRPRCHPQTVADPQGPGKLARNCARHPRRKALKSLKQAGRPAGMVLGCWTTWFKVWPRGRRASRRHRGSPVNQERGRGAPPRHIARLCVSARVCACDPAWSYVMPRATARRGAARRRKRCSSLEDDSINATTVTPSISHPGWLGGWQSTRCVVLVAHLRRFGYLFR